MDQIGNYISPWSFAARRIIQKKSQTAALETSLDAPGPSRRGRMFRRSSNQPTFWSRNWLWEGERGFSEEFTRLLNTSRELEIAVAPGSYPHKKFTKQDVVELESHISAALVDCDDNPQFKGVREQDGALVTVCVDQSTVLWFHSFLQTIKYDGEKLKVGVKEETPVWKVSFTIPSAFLHTSSNDTVNALVLQNPQLAGVWNIQGLEWREGQRVMVCWVGRDVLTAIKRMGNKAYLGMQQITLNVSTL